MRVEYMIAEWVGRWRICGGPFLGMQGARDAIDNCRERLHPACRAASRYVVVELPPPPADACSFCRLVDCGGHDR